MESDDFDRVKQFAKLKKFVDSTDEYVDKLLSCVGWNEDSIREVQQPLICPFNSSHHLSEKKLEQHLEKCQWRAEGYGDQDVPLSIPSSSSKTPYCVTFDEQLQEDVLQQAKLENPSMKIGLGGRLIPRTSDRFIADFTSDERRILYDFVVANTTQPDIGDDIANLNEPLKSSEHKESSHLELLAQERNLKRRRAKHRGIQTNKRSQTEICRELINQQMEALTEYISRKTELDRTETQDSSSHTSKELERKHIPRYERKSSTHRHSHDLRNYHGHDNQSYCSIETFHENTKMRESHDKDKHSKHRRKSSRDHEHYRSRESSNKKHKKSHKKHRSTHRHRDRTDQDRSNEHKTSRRSKKSKHDDKEK